MLDLHPAKWRALLACAVCWVVSITHAPSPAAGAEGVSPFPGTKSDWHGFDRYEFPVQGKTASVVVPQQTAPGKPWVWHGEFFGHKPAPDIALLGKGFHVVYLRVSDMLGCPDAVAAWNALYAKLTGKYGFGKKAALVGLSRGGLYVYNWAAANPDKVACIYADAAVCDFKSWPGGKGKGKGSPRDWKLVMERYGMTRRPSSSLFCSTRRTREHLYLSPNLSPNPFPLPTSYRLGAGRD